MARQEHTGDNDIWGNTPHVAQSETHLREEVIDNMAWERRGHEQFYYRSRRINRRVTKIYYGTGQRAQQAYLTDKQRQELRDQERAIRKQIEALDSHTDTLNQITRTLVKAHLLLAGFHQHKRIWRRKRRIHNTYVGT